MKTLSKNALSQMLDFTNKAIRNVLKAKTVMRQDCPDGLSPDNYYFGVVFYEQLNGLERLAWYIEDSLKTFGDIEIHNKSYRGWANYETCNVALWISNNKELYQLAKNYKNSGYKALAKVLKNELEEKTEDGVAWDDPKLDTAELDQLLKEL